MHQLLNKLAPGRPRWSTVERAKPAAGTPAASADQGVRIRGVDDLLVRFAKCCNPLPGDSIVGFITRGRGLTVHARDCLTVAKSVLDRERLIDVEWDVEEPAKRPVRIAVYIGSDRPGLLSEITGAISSRNGNITKAEVTVTDDRRGINHFVVEVADLRQLQDIMQAIREVRGRHQRRARPRPLRRSRRRCPAPCPGPAMTRAHSSRRWWRAGPADAAERIPGARSPMSPWWWRTGPTTRRSAEMGSSRRTRSTGSTAASTHASRLRLRQRAARHDHIYQGPIEEDCADEEEMAEIVRETSSSTSSGTTSASTTRRWRGSSTTPEPAAPATSLTARCRPSDVAFRTGARCSSIRFAHCQKFFLTQVSFVPMVSAYAENDGTSETQEDAQ